MISLGNVNFNMILSVLIIAFLLFMIGNHLFKKFKTGLEGFEGETPLDKATDEAATDKTATDKALDKPLEQPLEQPLDKALDKPLEQPLDKALDKPLDKALDKPLDKPLDKTSDQTLDKATDPALDKTSSTDKPLDKATDIPEEVPIDSGAETDKATTMTDLFESVNRQMDIIRTLKLSENMVPIKIDKKVPESLMILANLKLLINNGVYKNELDLKEVYDKYIGNKAIQVLASDINSLNMESSGSDMGALETSYLSRTKAVVDGHQKIIDKILENKSKE